MSDRLDRSAGSGMHSPSYLFESLDFPVSKSRFQAYLAEFSATAAQSKPHSHEGAEMLYVIEGSLQLVIHGRAETLQKGDSVYFDAGFEHSYRAADGQRCKVIVVVSGGNAAGQEGS